MAHVEEVVRLLTERGFPLEKIIFSKAETVLYNKETKDILRGEPWETEEITESIEGYDKYKISLLATNSDRLMEEFKSRVNSSERTIICIYDNAPTFHPAIKGNIFELVKVVFVKAK